MVEVANGMATTTASSTRLKYSSGRVTASTLFISAWWLTQMMPMPKKLIR